MVAAVVIAGPRCRRVCWRWLTSSIVDGHLGLLVCLVVAVEKLKVLSLSLSVEM